MIGASQKLNLTPDSTPGYKEWVRSAVLVDFGGVLTTSVLQAFEDFGASVGAVPGLLLELLRNDDACRRLLVEHECGGIDADAFDLGFAERLHAHGVAVDPDRLSVRMQAGLRRDDDIVRLIEQLRGARVPIALVSNAFGRDCYAGFDLNALADVVVISSEVGIRKPSRRISGVLHTDAADTRKQLDERFGIRVAPKETQ
jgi:putative hydrolase of the HAD superfamily